MAKITLTMREADRDVIRAEVDELAEGLHLPQTTAVMDAIHVRLMLMREIQKGTTIILERTNGERVDLMLTESWPPGLRRRADGPAGPTLDEF